MKMRKILIFSIFISFLIFPLVGYAQSQSQYIEKAPSISILGPGGVIDKIAKVLLTLLTLGAVLTIIYGAFLFLTSSGDPQKFDTARKAITYGLVGLIVGFSAWGIVALVREIFTPSGGGGGEFNPLDPGGEMGPY